MSSTGGTITIQVGDYANHVGSHFWNVQDETLGYVGDAQWGAAAEEVLSGKLYTHTAQPYPRLVLVDLKGCMGGVRLQLDPSADAEAAAKLCGFAVEVLETSARVAPSTFYQRLCEETEGSIDEDAASEGDERDMETGAEAPEGMDDEDASSGGLAAAAEELDNGPGPKYFSDFLKTLLHPRTVLELPFLGSVNRQLSGYGHLTAQSQMCEQALLDVDDRVRVFAEECDSIEAVQLLVDDSSMWSGFGASIARAIKDDYAAQSILAWCPQVPLPAPSQDPIADAVVTCRTLSQALAAAELASSSALCVPMLAPPSRSPCLLYDHARPFHASALQAAALDSATLPCRLYPSPAPVQQPGFTKAGSDALLPGGPPSQGALSFAELCADIAAPAANFGVLGMSMSASNLQLVAAAGVDARLSARERRLRGLPVEPEPEVSAALVQKDVSWFVDDWNPLQGLLSEHISWRGCRHSQQPLPCRTALDYLKKSLETEGIRAMHKRAAVAMPLPVPLPFPSIFGPNVTRAGDKVPSADAPERSALYNPTETRMRKRQAPSTCPVLTRLAASSGFGNVLVQHANVIKGALRSAPGKACLDAWSLERDDILELRESLMDNAHRYPVEESDEDD